MHRKLSSGIVLSILALGPIGCHCNEDEAAPGGGEAAARAVPQLEEYEDLERHLDFLALTHLADVDDGGLFIDFGTPAAAKYTTGGWQQPEWGSEHAEGDVTFQRVGRRGRVYFDVDEPGPMVARVRLRAHGTRALTAYMNDVQLPSSFLGETSAFQEIDIPLPAERVTRGENYFLLTFGGTTPIDGADVAAAIDWVRVTRGATAPTGEYQPPLYDTLEANVRLDGTERASLVARRPTTLRFHVQVPEAGKLGFGVGVEGADTAPIKVVVTDENGQRRDVFTRRATGEWHDEVVDLASYAGKVVRIDLVAEGSGAGRVAWAQPALYVPEVERAPLPRQAKNVVVLLVDTLRASKLRPFNARTRVRTPVFDRLAEAGTVFELAQSPENWTKPSVASVLTGLYPMTHQTKRDESVLSGDAVMLSEHLKANGFTTASFIANGYVSNKFGFDQGWDHYTNYIREGRSTEAENVFHEAQEWIAAHRNERFFVYVQTIDPHVPYDPPDEYLRMYDTSEYAGQVRPRMTPELLEKAKRNPPAVTFDEADRRRLEALHDGEISYHDHYFGLFLEKLAEVGVAEDTLVIVTSDHGEEFNDHGSWGHGHSVYQELLHVPLVIHMAGVVPARRIPDVVGTLSIPATVTELTGIAPITTAEGPSLLPYLQGAHPTRPAVAFSDFQDDRRVIVTGRWKLIVRGNLRTAMFDLERDPGEQHELAVNASPIARRYCRTMLSQFLWSNDRANWLSDERGRARVLRSDQANMDEATRGQLRALGYAN